MIKNAGGLIGWSVLVLVLVFLGSCPAVKEPMEHLSGHYPGQVVGVAESQSSVTVTHFARKDQLRELVPVPADLRAFVKSSIHPGDLVEVKPATKATTKATTKAEPEPKLDLQIGSQPVPASKRLWAMLGAAVLLMLFAWVVLGQGSVAQLILGIDGLYSKSKFQFVVWFAVLMVAYLSTLWLRFCYSSNLLIGSVQIPANLLALSGFSALSFAGAKAITQTKQDRVDAAVAKGVPGASDLYKAKDPNRPANLIYDLVHDDDVNVDLGDFQMVLITLVAALTYLVQVFQFLHALDLSATVTLPDVDSTLLAAFGLGQGTYLLKKAASGANPDPNPTAGGGAVPAAPVAPLPPAAPIAPPAPAAPAAAPAVPPQAAPRTRTGVEA